MGGHSLVSLFRRQVRRGPFRTALVHRDRTWTYAQLDAWSDAVHGSLQRAGVGQGEFVGIGLPNGPGVVAAILGVLKAGCAYLPLDPSYPADRLAFMAADAAVSGVLVADDGAGFTGMVAIEMVGSGDGRGPGPGPAVAGDAAAYVLYTSGSTGRPKGVVVTHANVIALFNGASEYFRFGPSDRWSLFHSYSFDVSVWEIWGALLHGGSIICVPDATRLHPTAFSRFLAEYKVTVLNLVPSVFRQLLASHPGRHDELRLRYLTFAGEPVDIVALRRWFSDRPVSGRPQVVNMYGTTETTVHATYRLVTSVDETWGGPGTLIGVPLPHLAMRLLDEHERAVEPGAVGEIFITGGGLSSGYLNRPELNRYRFPVLPGEDGRGVRCFRSGDLAHWDPDQGSLVYHGRADHQVKLHGFRIELGEVESVLRSSPDVADAAVALEAAAGEPVLTAYLVPLRDDADQADRISRHAASLLPSYMVPERFRFIPAMPLTPTGKTDRASLVATYGRS